MQHFRFILRAHVDMNAYRIGPYSYGILHLSHKNLVIGIRTQRTGCREMDDQTDIASIASVAVQRQAHVSQNSIGSALSHLVHCGRHVRQAGDGAYGDAVIHRYNDRSASLAIQNALQSYRLSDLAHDW